MRRTARKTILVLDSSTTPYFTSRSAHATGCLVTPTAADRERPDTGALPPGRAC